MGQKDACGFVINHLTGSPIRWNRSQFPVSFYIHQSVPREAKKNFISATEQWNIAWEEFLINRGIQGFPLFSIVDESNQYTGSPRNDTYNMLFFITDKFSVYDSEKVQAITAMSSNRRGEVKDTDIIVNSVNFKYFYDEDYNRDIFLSKKKHLSYRKIASSQSESFWFRFTQQIKSWFSFLFKAFTKKKKDRSPDAKVKVPRGSVDFASLMVHELGHVPGLAHFDKSDEVFYYSQQASNNRGDKPTSREISVMEPKLASGRLRRNIKDYDLSNLLCGYFSDR